MTDSDRELLKLAAKAAGIEIDGWSEYKNAYWTGDGRLWNSITDDGDALRLAVELRMSVDTDFNGGANAGNAEIDFDEPEYAYSEGTGKPDPYAAARRAITRAAAEQQQIWEARNERRTNGRHAGGAAIG